MGMFDYIRCKVDLPETDIPPPVEVFQTKDTPDQYMTLYTITAKGRLMWRPYEHVIVPKAERPYPDAPDDDFRAAFGMLRRVEKAPEILDDFDGDIVFYEGNFPDVGWWEYRARFMDGHLSGISLEAFHAPEGRDTNAEISATREEQDDGPDA
mgnify:CR=1 FL=1